MSTTDVPTSRRLIQICLRVPNLGSLVFFLVFVLAIPAILLNANQLVALQFYLPLLVMMAVTLAESGYPNYFQNLYPLGQAQNLSGFVSRTFINTLAALGILSAAILTTVNSGGNVALGMTIGIIGLGMAFPIATQVIPFFIRQVDALLRELTKQGTKFPGNWHKYFTGMAFILFFISMQFVLTRYAKDTIVSDTRSNNFYNTNTTNNTSTNNTSTNNTSTNNTKSTNNTSTNNTKANNTSTNNTKANNTSTNNTKANNNKANNTSTNNTKANNTSTNNTKANNKNNIVNNNNNNNNNSVNNNNNNNNNNNSVNNNNNKSRVNGSNKK